MAGRPINKLHQADVRSKFYVYELGANSVEYVGKGSGRRLDAQKRKYGLPGRVVAWFDSEKAAYAFEVQHIAAVCPPMNKHKGGNGSKAGKAPRYAKDKFDKLCEKLGTRVVAARIALHFPWLLSQSKIDAIRHIAYEGC